MTKINNFIKNINFNDEEKEPETEYIDYGQKLKLSDLNIGDVFTGKPRLSEIYINEKDGNHEGFCYLNIFRENDHLSINFNIDKYPHDGILEKVLITSKLFKLIGGLYSQMNKVPYNELNKSIQGINVDDLTEVIDEISQLSIEVVGGEYTDYKTKTTHTFNSFKIINISLEE